MNLTATSASNPVPGSRRALLEQQLRNTAAAPEALPLSFAQQRLWVLDQLEPDSALYNVPLVLSLTGVLDERALQRALDTLTARHEVLRTRFVCHDETPVQLIEETANSTIATHDLTGISEPERTVEARSRVRVEINRSFNLSTGPLLRAALLHLAEHEHWFVLTFHHIIADEWSLKNCFRELTSLYEAYCTGQPPQLPDLPIQYADYAVWQRTWLKNGVIEEQLDYWREQLRGHPPVLELPADLARPPLPSFRGDHLARELEGRLAGHVKDLATRLGASPFMVLLAGFNALLHRYTRQTDILVGSPVAGRNRIETEDLIGFFVNTLVLRTDLSGNPRFDELVRRVRETTLGAHAHQELPFEKLVEELCPERTLDHMPFTRVMFAVQNSGLEELRWPGLALRFIDAHTDSAKFDLTFVVRDTSRGFTAQCEFNSDLFRPETIRRLLEHFEVLLTAAVEHPEWTLSKLPLLTPEEHRRVLVEWPGCETPFPRNATVSRLFEEQAERAAGKPAVTFGGTSISWGDLNSRANQLARHLGQFGVGPNVPVGLCLERSTEMIIAMLAVLKAGGAYLPLDPRHPKPRLEFMLEDSRAPVLLTQQKLLGELPRNPARVVCLDSDWELVGRESRANLPGTAAPEDVAYIMYTSGSTGQPKGVAVPHRAIVRLVRDANYIQITPEDRIAQASNTSFDAATFEIWGALLNGAELAGVSREQALSPAEFAAELRDRRITILFLTTALFNQVAADQPDAFASLRVVLFGGEAVDPKWVRAVLAHPPRHLLHVYGPTENTTFTTWHEVTRVDENAKTIPIGRPISNTQCFILDPELNPVPVGVPGELHVAGDGLAHGYWNRPDLTQQKFISNPSGPSIPKSLYRTGDLVRWLSDGTIEFIGRADQQVKIRGFRIEPGEIEASLQSHPGVRECAVTVYTESNDKRLLAYFVPNGRPGPGISELRSYLKEKLPDYMVPSSFIRLDTLPLTPNGKVDRDALPEPDRKRPDLGRQYASPQDAVEVELARIWENVLGIQPIGIEDRFFELGGHSLLAVRVIAQIEKTFGRKLRLATIFQAQTIEQLAAILRKEIHEDSAISGTSLVEIQPRGSRPPLFFIHGAGGGMFWGYVNLSRHLGYDQPVYGLRSREPDAVEQDDTIEQMAARYIADMRAIQPVGPYHLGGYCFGGNLAFEMARQLREQGEEIAILALFNCAPANSSYSRIPASPAWILRFFTNLWYWAKYFCSWTPAQRREFVRWKKDLLGRRIRCLLGRPSNANFPVDPGDVVDLSSYSPDQRKLWESHIRALIKYHPKPFAGRVHLFRSPGHPLLCSFAPDYGWSELARDGVEICTVPGVHEKILEEPCVATLAERLNEALTLTAAASSHPARSPSVSQSGRASSHLEPPAGAAYPAYFEAQVARTPEAIAVRFQNEQLTYAELNDRANRLAHHLQECGVAPETLVAVNLNRSLDLPVALLAVLKAGGAYLPLDRSYPAERLDYMIGDSQVRVLLTDSRFAGSLDSRDLRVICLDDPATRDLIGSHSGENPENAAGSENLAYVIYTSGSTGKPKGVEITHGALLNHNHAVIRAFALDSRDRVLQFTPVSFDISVEELFPTWLAGAAVIIRTDDLISATAHFAAFVGSERITVLNLPTAYWHELTDYVQSHPLPSSVRLVVIGGEKAADDVWRRWSSRVPASVKLLNSYGPTEATVTATLHVAKPGEQSLPIGRPLDGVEVLVLDKDLQPVRNGEPGELHIGGRGLARGYLRRPELTAEKFIRNPLPEGDGGRLYKTGDLVRFLPDGELEFVGRTDDQVKIRGYRIELGEIESALRTHSGVKEAVVVARDDAHGKRLIACFVPQQGAAPGASELRNHLKAKLPAFMVPAFFIPIERMPLSPAGKLDRHALPAPEDTRPELDQEFVAPRTPIEEAVAGIWCEVLGLDRVGVHDNFFDLGGHSLLAAQVIARIRESLQTEVALASVFSFPTIAALAERLTDGGAQRQPVLPAFAIARGRRLPLTAAQQRLWFLDQFDPSQSAYNITTAFRLKGKLDLDLLEQSLSELTRRHEALRAVFPTENGDPVQIICEPKPVKLSLIDLSDESPEERDSHAWRTLEQEAARSYVMSNPVLRPVIIKLTQDEYLFLLMTHRIACDSESVLILVRELSLLYSAFASGTQLVLPEPPLAYSETLLIPTLAREEESRELEFWKHQLEGAPALVDLPADRPRPAHQSDHGRRIPLRISSELTTSIKALAGQLGCGLFDLLAGTFQLLLARYTGSTDIVVGSTLSTRNLRGGPGVVGKFDNIVVLRAHVTPDQTFAEWMKRTAAVVAAARAHGGLPFERLIDELKPERNASHTPVVQVMFDFDECGPQPIDTAGLLWTPLLIDNHTAKLDLQLYLAQASEQLEGWIEFNTALFDEDRMARMAGHFEQLLRSAATTPDVPVSQLPMLRPAEARLLLEEWNATALPYGTDATLAMLFEEQVERSPSVTAVIAGSDRLSYRELNTRANQLAHYLKSAGVGPGVLVGICLERSWRLMVAILGVLKAGGAYVPLDPAYPRERLAFILQDAKAPVLITQESLRNLHSADTRLVCLDTDWERIHGAPRENPGATAGSSDLAYVIYTSGSTGRPKGVAIEHRAPVALIAWAQAAYTAEELAGVLASTSICFDLSVFEMFVPLSLGGTVILAENALALPSLPARSEVTLVNTVPSAIRELLRVGGIPESVRVVNLAGEPLATSLVDLIHAKTRVDKVYDLYGPSETTTYSTGALRRPEQPATIGRPLRNEQVYLLDAARQPVPIGVPGEIYIGGDKLARGYLNRPELTAEKFVPNPFRSGTKLYRTGDLARWRADGNLEFLGRNDHQVKIRGFRIELGEIENALKQHPSVRDVVLVVREEAPGEKRLVAYVVAGTSTPAEELRRFVKERIPEYMVPGAFVFLEALPLTPNGKIDRKALPKPEPDRSPRDGYAPPRTLVERELAGLFQEVLHLDRIGIRDNFFELGGHSLLAIQLISRVRETLKVELPLFSLFEAPSIETLGRGIESGEWTANQRPLLPFQTVPRDQRLPLSFVQERLWFLDQLHPGSHAYHVPMAWRLRGLLDAGALQRAFEEVMRRHEVLRTTFDSQGGNVNLRITTEATAVIESLNLEDCPEEERESRVQSWFDAESKRPFDLQKGPLIRIALARLSPTDHALLVVMHHAICDGWSLTILFQEVEALYESYANNTSLPPLPDLPVQYADYAYWKREWLQGPALESELNFWMDYLKGAPHCIALPKTGMDVLGTNRAGRERLLISAELTAKIAAASQRRHTTSFAVLLAGLAVVLRKWTGQDDLVIGTVVAGRNRRELENVIGCFMNFLPIRARVGERQTADDFLAAIAASVLGAQSHQDCPFEKIVEAVNPARRQDGNPLYNVALLLQNFPSEMFKNTQLQASPIPIEPDEALLDLRFEVEPAANGLRVSCEYRKGLFLPETLQHLLAAFRNALEFLVLQPSGLIEEIPVELPEPVHSAAPQADEAADTIAIASTFTAEPIEDSLRFWSAELDCRAEVRFAPFNQVFQQLLDPSSLLSGNARGVNVLLVRLEDWLEAGARPGVSHRARLERIAGEFIDALRTAATRPAAPFVVLLCPPSNPWLGDPEAFRMLEEIESFTVTELNKESGVHAILSRELLEQYPVTGYYDASADELGRVPYSPVFFTALGTAVARRWNALNRASHKVIVLDCDHTLWSGVCAEDGAKGICLDEPRRALQEFMRAQSEAGRLLAICSKNEDHDVREVFAQRVDMPLRPEHIAAWRANWLPKPENLRSIARELNLGMDSFIFVDDNPVECAAVEAECPEVLTLLLPETPVNIPQFLKHCWAFDHARLTAEDRRRGESYRKNRERDALRANASSLADFIESLQLQVGITPLSDSQLSRVSQLTHRTNQFNCTTIRRSENEIRALTAKGLDVLTVSVRDRFGDYGLVGVVIYNAEPASISVETLLLSCRVLGRGVEHRILAHLGGLAAQLGRQWVDIHFHPSPRNKPAENFLQSVGSEFRQALNGGFLYRFPTEIAAAIRFKAPITSSDTEKNESAERSAGQSPAQPAPSRKLHQCRDIALRYCDAARIHEVIESRSTRHEAGRSGYSAPSSETERQLCRIWERLLRTDGISVDDDFFRLGGHSLLAVRLFAEIESLTGRKLPLVTLFQAPTIRQLACALDEKLRGETQSPLAPVQPNGSQPPLFLVHGAGGDVLWGYANLAACLDPDQPVYGIKSRGQIGLDEYESIEEMARYYVQEMRKFQPRGPYYLGGYCLGGNVAYEMARQLHGLGERVALVALIDAFPSNAGYERMPWWRPGFHPRFARNLYYWLKDFAQLEPQERSRFISRKARILGRKLASKWKRDAASSSGVDLEEVIDPHYFPQHELRFWEIHLRALVAHVERPYAGAVTLIRTRGQPVFCSLEDDFCWSRLARGGVSVRQIPGSHENIFVEPNVRFLAQELNASLAAARATPTPDRKDSITA